jgi:tetratricopeptide (TPR) repeat protein
MAEPLKPAEPASESRRTSSSKGRPLSRRRKWLFRFAAVVLSLLPFVVLELALRWRHVGHETRLIVPTNPATPTTFRFNPDADRAYYGVENLWGPDLRPFEAPKPDGVYRIVVVGGSSVAGFPYPFELAMPRQLELVLNRQAPERTFEVLNAGMTAIMSSSEVDVVRQAIACQPDLIVIHTGHNEFYGPGGSASKFGGFAPDLYPLTQLLKRQRSFQLLLSAFPKPEKTHLVETLPADINIPLDGDVYRATEQRFRRNLERMIEIASDANTPILLTTVPANLRDTAPLQPPTSEAAADKLKQISRLITYREYENALAALAEAARIAPDDPLVVYRTAQCLEGLGRNRDAAEKYVLAADLDGCRFRAASSFLNLIRDVAQEAGPSVHFCDVEAELRSRSEFPAPGADFFLEHVHFNFEGNWQVACILGRNIVEDVLGGAWQTERAPDAATRNELLGVTQLDHLAADSMVLIGFNAWPFNLSPARIEEIQALKGTMGERFAALDPAEREIFAGLSMDAMHQHLQLAMGDGWLAIGNAERALAAYQRHIERRPWEVFGYQRAATALESLGRRAEANKMLARGGEKHRGSP